LSGLYWISISLTHDEAFTQLRPFAIILVPAFLAIFYGTGTLIVKAFVSRKISFVLIFSLVFSILEFIRGNVLSGFPWNLIAYSWSWSLEIIQIISLIGTYSLNLMSITIFSLPFILFVKTKYINKYLFFFFLLILFSTNYLYGFKILSQTKEKNVNKHDFKIKILAPNIDLKEFHKGQNNDAIIKQLIELSEPQSDQKTIFIWPEGMLPYMYLSEIKKYKELFSNTFSNLHLIIFGINSLEYQNNIENVYNSLVIVDNNLNLINKYNKHKLVPFGEFLPMEKYFEKIGFKTISYGYKSFSQGKERDIINIKNKYYDFELLPLICYEIIYTGQINPKKEKLDLIVNISEDGWFGDSVGPYQHFSKTIYRAIEEGNYIARSSNNGISAFIDPNGRILDKIEFNKVGSIVASLPTYETKTIFSKYGNKIFVIIVFLYILLIFYFKKVEKNEKKQLSFYK
jgi:apolipoprotein N-acyltransferase